REGDVAWARIVRRPVAEGARLSALVSTAATPRNGGGGIPVRRERANTQRRSRPGPRWLVWRGRQSGTRAGRDQLSPRHAEPWRAVDLCAAIWSHHGVGGRQQGHVTRG